jgi:hypothetical protein
MAFQPLTKEQYQKAINAGFTPQQIIEMEKKRKAENAEPEKGYLSRVYGEYKEAGQNIISGIEKGAQTMEQGIKQGGVSGALKTIGGALESGLRTVGGVAGATFAPITEAPIVRPALEAIGTGISKIPSVDIIVNKANELAIKYPERAKDFQDIVNIAILGGGKTAQKPLATALEKTGVGLEKSGIKSAETATKTFAEKLVMPVETKAVKLAQVGRTTEAKGFFKKDIIAPTKLEVQAAEEVAQIPGISSKNTFQKNFNIVRDYNVGQAKQLEADIARYDFAISKKEVLSKLDEAAKSLQDNPLIVGDAEKTANKLIGGAKQFIQANEAKGSGILKARKEFDNWVLRQKPKAFDAKSENAFTIANKEIRDTLNTILDENATNLGIKDSLRKQFSIYRAMENIAPKAAEEANTPIRRAFNNVMKTIGIKNKLVQAVAAAVGIGGLGAAATFAPAAVVVGTAGFVFYKAGKLVMKPEVRIAIGKLLQTSGHLINPADKKILQDALEAYKK